MSAFLGPIHSWLFHKIRFQDELTEIIVSYAKEQGYDADLQQELNQKYGRLETGELADIVDEMNIHGWLQQRVSLVESRLAYATMKLIKEHPERIDEIEKLMYQAGQEHAFPANVNAKEAWLEIKNILLDGMPCDHVNQMLLESEQEVRYQVVADIHGSYWTNVGGSVSDYYMLKQSLINGLLSRSEYVMTPDGDEIWTLKHR